GAARVCARGSTRCARWSTPLVSAPSSLERLGQIGRERRLGLDLLARERVREGEPRCMEELALEAEAGDAVDPVADDGEIDGREVDADLVRAACLEPDAQERMLRQQLDDLDVRDGLTRRVRVQR